MLIATDSKLSILLIFITLYNIIVNLKCLFTIEKYNFVCAVLRVFLSYITHVALKSNETLTSFKRSIDSKVDSLSTLKSLDWLSG